MTLTDQIKILDRKVMQNEALKGKESQLIRQIHVIF